MANIEQHPRSSSSTHSSELTAVSIDPCTSYPPSGASEAIASPVDLVDDADQRIAYNTATPAHFVYRPPPQNATPANYVPEFIELEPGFNLYAESPTTLASWRYQGRAKIPNDSNDITLEPGDIVLSHSTIPGWALCIHPEGQPYYRQERQVGSDDKKFAIYTDHDLEDSKTLELIEYCVERFLFHLSRYSHVSSGSELVLFANRTNTICEDVETTMTNVWYYIATDTPCQISWIQPVSSSLITNNQRVVYSKPQLRDAYEFQYWQVSGNKVSDPSNHLTTRAHKELYPNHWHVSHGMLAELTESLHYLAIDSNTSETSTSPWDFQMLRNHLSIVEKINPETGTGRSSCIVARLMHGLSALPLSRDVTVRPSGVYGLVAMNRFQHYHGEQYARLNISDSVKEDQSRRPSERSLWFLCLLPLCFYLPDQYLEELEKIFVDDLLHYTLWNRYISGLKQDWENIMLPVTVLLTVNVGLLAIQSLDTGHSYRSAAQLSSYCSTIMSLGAIVMCIILSRQHRSSGHSNDMGDVGCWLKEQVKTRSRAELFVVTLSLPSVWFTWGVMMFCIALLWVAFDRTSWVTRVVSGIVALPTLAVVTWVITAAWKHKHRSTYLTGRLCEMAKSQWTQTQSRISTWMPTLRRPSAPEQQSRIGRKVSETSAV